MTQKHNFDALSQSTGRAVLSNCLCYMRGAHEAGCLPSFICQHQLLTRTCRARPVLIEALGCPQPFWNSKEKTSQVEAPKKMRNNMAHEGSGSMTTNVNVNENGPVMVLWIAPSIAKASVMRACPWTCKTDCWNHAVRPATMRFCST